MSGTYIYQMFCLRTISKLVIKHKLPGLEVTVEDGFVCGVREDDPV